MERNGRRLSSNVSRGQRDLVTETLAERALATGSRPKTVVSGGRILLSRCSVHYVRNSCSSYR